MRDRRVEKWSLQIASDLANAKADEAFEIFLGLREQGRLSSTVRALNTLLTIPEHRGTALIALRRIGLEYSG